MGGRSSDLQKSYCFSHSTLSCFEKENQESGSTIEFRYKDKDGSVDFIFWSLATSFSG